jgi:hypothetical protein
MSEQECDELEKEEIKQEEEVERKRRRNILLDLDNRCEMILNLLIFTQSVKLNKVKTQVIKLF